MRNHVFYDGLKGTEANLERLTGALEAVTDERLAEYADAVPREWKTVNKAADEIVKYLREAREHCEGLMTEITRALQ